MEDIDKITKAYEACKNSFNRKCSECPYDKDCYHDGFHARFVKDAIEMLKLQQLDIQSMRDTMQSMIEGVCVFAGNKQIIVPSIVRCKDCKHRYNDDECPYCNRCGRRDFPNDYWYCADGEKRE